MRLFLFCFDLVDVAVLHNHFVSPYIFLSYILFYKYFFSVSVVEIKVAFIDSIFLVTFLSFYLATLSGSDLLVRFYMTLIRVLFSSTLSNVMEFHSSSYFSVLLKPLYTPTRIRDIFDASISYRLSNDSLQLSGAAFPRVLLKV